MNKNTLISLLVIIVLALGGWMFFGNDNGTMSLLKTSKLSNKYQAVFLSNGQVYFGKVANLNSNIVTLTDIYYLRVQQQVQPAGNDSSAEAADANSEDQAKIQLVKLGDELHGPEDAMFLNREHVLFVEDLKDSSQVVQAIKTHKSGNTNTSINSGDSSNSSENN